MIWKFYTGISKNIFRTSGSYEFNLSYNGIITNIVIKIKDIEMLTIINCCRLIKKI